LRFTVSLIYNSTHRSIQWAAFKLCDLQSPQMALMMELATSILEE